MCLSLLKICLKKYSIKCNSEKFKDTYEYFEAYHYFQKLFQHIVASSLSNSEYFGLSHLQLTL